jgi:hypothetical protein
MLLKDKIIGILVEGLNNFLMKSKLCQSLLNLMSNKTQDIILQFVSNEK